MTKIDSKFLIEYFNEKISSYTYSIPIKLHEIIKTIVLKEFKNISDLRILKKQNTYISCANFLIIAILHFNKEKKDYLGDISFISPNRKLNIYLQYDSIIGCQLSKEILTSVVSTSILYKIKKLLIENNIINLVELNNNKYYSKKNKLAIRYIINKNYLDYKNTISIENKYADKLAFLLKKGLLLNKKRILLNQEKLPYNNSEKNYQYLLQKELSFNKEEFYKLFVTKYPFLTKYFNLFDILEQQLEYNSIKLKEITPEILADYKLYKSINSHVFNASESFGRIYMPFQYMDKIYRSALIYNNMHLIEIFDMKCCFIQLAAMLFKKDTNLNIDANKIIALAQTDIYQEIANKEHISREDAKNTLMEFMFENSQTRLNKNKIIHNHIVNYFLNEHYNFYNWLNNYKTKTIIIDNKPKCISLLNRACTQLEANLMFELVIPYVKKTYPNYKFFSLHDGIWTTDNFKFNIRDQITNLINRYN